VVVVMVVNYTAAAAGVSGTRTIGLIAATACCFIVAGSPVLSSVSIATTVVMMVVEGGNVMGSSALKNSYDAWRNILGNLFLITYCFHF
jgi:hypothetical protein